MGFSLEHEGITEPAYNPYSKAQAERIKELWSIYREDVGLEGDIYHNLVKEGKDQGIIDSEITDFRKSVEKSREAWHNLLKENNIQNDR